MGPVIQHRQSQVLLLRNGDQTSLTRSWTMYGNNNSKIVKNGRRLITLRNINQDPEKHLKLNFRVKIAAM